jgi:hypothetical protein
MRSFIRPAAVKIGIAHIGWHTFRHTYSTLLGATKADIKGCKNCFAKLPAE